MGISDKVVGPHAFMPSIPSLHTQQLIQQCQVEFAHTVIDDANQEDRGHLIDKTLSEMQVELKASKEEADRAPKAKMCTHARRPKTLIKTTQSKTKSPNPD